MPIECGGINSTIPLVVGAMTGLPVVDADGMGRAFPELQMETFSVLGVQRLADGRDQRVRRQRDDQRARRQVHGMDRRAA